MSIIGSAFHATHIRTVSSFSCWWRMNHGGSERWMGRAPAVHDPIVRTRFEKTNHLLRLRAAEHIWYPTRFPSFPVNRLQQDSSSCLTPLNASHQVAIFQRRHLHRRWLKECMMSPSADIASTTSLPPALNSNRLHWRQHRSQFYEEEWRGRTSGCSTSLM